MKFKDLIKTQLSLLKDMGKSRRQIELDLGYSEHYIDQCLSRGGNESLLNALSNYKSRLEREDDQESLLNDGEVKLLTPQDQIRILLDLNQTQKENIHLLEKERKHQQVEIAELKQEIKELKLLLKGNTGGRRHSA